MTTILSDERGMVVEARDALGTYYYLANSFGTPTAGAYSSERIALEVFEADNSDAAGAAADLEMNSSGHRLAECAYCGRMVRPGEQNVPRPAPDDDESWEELAAGHGPDCEWVATRAHMREAP